MTYHQHSSIISTDMHIHRHRQGICLADPDSPYADAGTPLSHLFDSPIVTYFMDADSCAVRVNEACAALNSAASTNDMIHKNATYYYKTESALLHMAEDKYAINTKTLYASGGASTKIDDVTIDVINFKIPWYQGSNIIGVLGLTLHVDKNNMDDLSENLVTLLGSNIFSPYQAAQLSTLNTKDKSKVYFTPREMDVLFHLLRGRTAKEIGVILSISRRTVENLIGRMREKSDCKSKYELIAKYFHLAK